MTPTLGTIAIDLPRLLETRMLIQANSGAGKSHALRRVLEQTAPLVQQLVIDPEGEFQTLRERFDYIVCAPSGADAVATPKTAAALAVALWRSGSSAVVDIYELQKHERVLFVRRFLEALTAAPKSAWHSTIVALDEIQDYCPETGSSESSSAVVDLAARGRKRGLCLLGATQRIARLSKDCAAELLNKAIGRTGMDIDVRRAMAELGMSNYREALETLRNLEAGEFFVFGPALSRSVERTKFGPVVTTHPEIGQKALGAPPPASAKIMAQLAKIEGLQRAAETETKSLAEAKAENVALRREVAEANRKLLAAPAAGASSAEVERRISAGVKSAMALLPPPAPARLPAKTLRAVASAIAALQAIEVASGAEPAAAHAPAPPAAETKRPVHATNGHAYAPKAAPRETTAGISGPQQRILDSLAALAAFGVAQPEKETLAAHAGVPASSGGYRNNLSVLKTAGLIDYPSPGLAALTDAGAARAHAPDHPPTLDDLHNAWLGIVSGPQQAILRTLIGAYPQSIEKSDLAGRVGVPASSGGYRNNLSRLKTMRAIDYPSPGAARAAAILFPERT